MITLFSITLIYNFYVVQNELKVLSERNRLIISKDIDYTIFSWIQERINNLEINERHLNKEALLGNEKELLKYLDIFLNNKLHFDTVQAYITDVYFFVNSTPIFDFRKKLPLDQKINNEEVYEREWFKSTKESMKTTMNIMPYHGVLLQETINICTPIIRNNENKGILCGIIKLNEVLKKVKKLHFPKYAYYFITDKEGNLLTKIDKNKKTLIKNLFEDNKINMKSLNYQETLLDKDVITIRKFNHFDWYIGVGIDNHLHNSKVFQKFTTNSLILFFLFLFLVIIINSAHEFLRRRVEKQKEEYEYILAHRSRMSEIGELISGINHQLYQPINSLSLLLSNTLLLQKGKKLDEEILNENLHMCEKATGMMSDTIKMFRNFYRCNESITVLSLKDCVNSVIQVMHVDLTKNNIHIQVENLVTNDTIISVENFIQQILLVLIQNSKEAILNSNNSNRDITLKIDIKEELVYIDIIDKADGVPKEMIPKLFSNMKSSKKNLGSGIGLYFARKLAKEKLLGDLTLYQSSSPTVFRLTFLTQLPKKEKSCIIKS